VKSGYGRNVVIVVETKRCNVCKVDNLRCICIDTSVSSYAEDAAGNYDDFSSEYGAGCICEGCAKKAFEQ
jgi:hypothetical protein